MWHIFWLFVDQDVVAGGSSSHNSICLCENYRLQTHQSSGLNLGKNHYAKQNVHTKRNLK